MSEFSTIANLLLKKGLENKANIVRKLISKDFIFDKNKTTIKDLYKTKQEKSK